MIMANSANRSTAQKQAAGKRPQTWKKGQSGNLKGAPTGLEKLSRWIGAVNADDFEIDECEVRERFRIINEMHGWFRVEISQTGFPDFVLSDKNGGVVRAEVEVAASNFLKHGHDIGQCDLIIAWRNDWADCPLPVLCVFPEWANYLQLRQVKPFVVVKDGRE